MCLDHLIGKFADWAGRYSSALVENAELAGHTAREGQLLFDEQDGEAFILVELQNDIADFVDDIGLDAFRGLIEN